MINNLNEYQLFKKELEDIKKLDNKPSLLLHSCCGPCSSYCLSFLNEYFNITIYYYNPNIYPKDEFMKRVDTQKEIIQKLGFNVNLIIGNYDYNIYKENVKGLENLGELSERCYNCYKFRIIDTARVADELNFDYYTTTLSISPYKSSKWINEIGKSINSKSKYLYSNFKKEDGYKKSILLSKKYNLYRQDYCGCEYSILEHESILRKKENQEINNE